MRLILFLLPITLLTSCNSTKKFLKEEFDYEFGKNSDTDEYVYIDVKRNETGIEGLESSYANTGQVYEFTYIGQSYLINRNQPFTIAFKNIDPDDVSLITSTNEYSDELKITLVSKKLEKVILSNKCEVIEIKGLETIPRIEINKGLQPEQVIITPLFDTYCNQIGYQIRYGSIESGCYRTGKYVVDRFNNCVKKKHSSGSTKNTEKRNRGTRKSDCLKKIWFDLECD